MSENYGKSNRNIIIVTRSDKTSLSYSLKDFELILELSGLLTLFLNTLF